MAGMRERAWVMLGQVCDVARAHACVCRGAQGVDLGPLQGIPYGLKDLIAVEGYRTTWGAPAYLAQVLPDSAAVYGRCAAPRTCAPRTCTS